MTLEQQFFLQILSDHINERETIIPESVDWTVLHEMAKKHQVEAVVYKQTKKTDFSSAYGMAVYNYINRKADLTDLFSSFTGKYFLVKGPVIAEKYPVPALRTMGDVDIIVRPADKEQLHELLLTKGFSANKSDREWTYQKKNAHYEVHDRLVYEVQRKTEKQTEFFNSCWDYINDNALDWNFHFIFLIFHLRKHFVNQGVGFRQFLDIAVAIKNIDLDWKWIANKLKEIEMYTFAAKVTSLCHDWFETETPIDTELDAIFSDEATALIFENGVFGFDNKENQKNVVENYVRQHGKSSMISRFLSDVFLSYNDMVKLPEYHFLKNKKWLLPAGWIYRIVLKIKQHKLGKLRTHYFITNKEITERESHLRKWGIQ